MSFGGLPPVVVRFVGDATSFLNEQKRVIESAKTSAAKLAEAAKAEADAAEAAAKRMQEAAVLEAQAAKDAADAYELACIHMETANGALTRATKANWDERVAAQRAALAEMNTADAARAEAAASAIAADKAATDATVAASAKRTEANAAASTASAAMWAGTAKTARNTGMLVGAVALGVGLGVTDMAAKFEKSTNLLVTAGGESQTALAGVRDGILSIARSTGTSTTDLSNGMYILEKAGFDAAHGGLDVLRLSAQGAKAEGVDLATMTNALTDIMFNYGIGAGQAASTTNMLVKGAGEAKTTMQEYSASLASLIPIGSKADLSFSQLGGALATITQHGMTAQQGAQNLAHAIQMLSNPTQPMINQMAQMGLNAQQVAQDLGKKGLTGTMDEVYQAVIHKMGPAGLTLQSAFNDSKIAANDMQVMLDGMPPHLKDLSEQFAGGSLSFTEYRKAFRGMGAEGVAMGSQFASLAQRADGFNQQLKQAKPENQTFLSAMRNMVGGQDSLRTALMLTGSSTVRFKENVEGISKAGLENSKDITTWATTSSGLAVQFDQLKESAATLAIGLGQQLLPMAKTALGYVQGFFNWVQSNPGMFQALAIGIGVVSVALGVFAAAWAVVTIVTTPYVAVVAGVILAVLALGAAVAWLATHWGDVTNFVRTVWGGFLNWTKSVIDGFVNWWNGVWNGFVGFFRGIWNGILTDVHHDVDAFMSVWNPIAGFFIGLWNGIVTVAKWALALLYTAVVTPIVILINVIKAAWDLFYQAVWKPVWDGIVKAGQAAWVWLNATVFKPIGDAITFMGKMWDWYWKNVITPVWNGIQQVMAAAWIWIEGNVVKPINDSITFMGKMWNWYWQNVITPVWNGIQQTITAVWLWIKGNVVDAIHTNIQAMGNQWNWLHDNIIVPVWNGIRDTINAVWIFIQGNVFHPIHDALDALGTAFNVAVGIISAAWQRIQDAARGPVQFIIDTVYNHGIRQVWNSIAQPLGLPSLDAVSIMGNSGAVSGVSVGGGPVRAFAAGGVMPGYSPGVDDQLIAVSGGEAIMRPEFTRFVGPEWVHAMNAAAKNGTLGRMQHFADGGIFDAIGGFVAGALNGLKNAALGGLQFAATPLVHGVEGLADSFLNGTGYGRMLDKGVHTLGDGFLNWIGGKDAAAKKAAAAAGATGTPVDPGSAGAGVQQWSGLVLQALHMVGQPDSLLGITLRRMNQESGGNPNAINNWDSNAAAGIPSQGLMQVIPPTFASYAMPGYSSNIDDPLSNILASMRYAMSRYGSLAAAYGQAGGYRDGGTVPILLDRGGYVMPGTHTYQNNTGTPERVSAPGGRGDGPLIGTLVIPPGSDPHRTAEEIAWAVKDY
jgi:hypothetical protein